jgi:outer membrane protein TolC
MRGTVAVLIAAMAALGPRAAGAQAESGSSTAPESPADWRPERRGATLARCLELAEKNYPKIHEARARLKNKRGQLFEARTAPWSDFTMTGGLGPAPTVRGTSIYSPNTDVSLTSNMALAWQIGIDGTIPLWTFGKIENLWDAAEAQVKLGEYEVEREKNDVRLDVRRAYYGLQLARDSRALVRDAASRIDRHINRLAARVAEGEGDDIDLLKLRMYRAELEGRSTEAERGEHVALAGLRFLTGVRDLDIPDQPLRRARHTLGPVTRYLEAARLFRPEINMARAGIAARRAQVKLAESRYYPDLAVGVNARWARAPEVTDQVNPYVNDRANYFHYGAALVFRWKLDFLPQTARIAQAEADLEEVRAKERYALGGVGVEVETAFADARAAERRLDAYTRALGYARQWLIKVQQGIDVGTFEDEEIADPAKEYAIKKFSQMSATYEYNIALAKLAQVTGWRAVLRD